MLRSLTLALAVLGPVAQAGLFQRAACNRDDCLRAVAASSAAPGSASASKDCISFLSKTYTPDPTTTTVTNTVTPTVSVTASQTITSTTTSTSMVSATTTETDTATATSTVTSTTTVTITQNQKRAIEARATVNSPSQVPTYASACSGTARYSSACSCNGISATTKTLAPSTITSTATATAAPSTTTVATVTFTSVVTSTVTNTQTLTATASTTVTTTTTTIQTATATVTASSGHACTPGAPGSLYPGQCGPSANSCACYIETDGSGYCAGYYGACGPACNSNGDCPSGSACLAASESDCGYAICATSSDIANCPTSGSQKRGATLAMRGSIARALADIIEADQRRSGGN